jgi:glycosyltransferase involved in cell wall biosynthesis
MIKLVELNYHCHTEYTTPEQVISKHALSSGFIHFIKDKVKLILVKHLNYEGEARIENIRYRFFKSRNKFRHIPFKTHRFIKNEKPDVVLVQGFVFVLQVMFLRWKLGKDCVIFVQHHGEKPFTGLKGFLQRKADACIDGYLFTALDNATVWLNKKIISKKEKCFEVLSASTYFGEKDKTVCKARLNMAGENNFLWVGRLNNNKDPISVISAFEKYLDVNKLARLYMIYQTAELIEDIRLLIAGSETLKNGIFLIGKVENRELEYWYNGADFYISGSHSEGSGYALVEAMACGCIPVITAIPSFKKITCDGKYGILFEPGNTEDLYKNLLGLEALDKEKYSRMVRVYAAENLSYKAVADQIYQLSVSLITK